MCWFAISNRRDVGVGAPIRIVGRATPQENWEITYAPGRFQSGSDLCESADVLKSISLVKNATAETAPIGFKANQIQNDIDEVAPPGSAARRSSSTSDIWVDSGQEVFGT